MTDQIERKFVTIKEAARFCRVSERSIRRAIEEGRVPVVYVGPRLPRIDLDELLAALRGAR
jgi:excisionase family DNA binding protein